MTTLHVHPHPPTDSNQIWQGIYSRTREVFLHYSHTQCECRHDYSRMKMLPVSVMILAKYHSSARSDVYGAPFSHLFTELKISPIEVHISAIQLQISSNRLNCRYLQMNCRYLQMNCRYLQMNCRYLQFN